MFRILVISLFVANLLLFGFQRSKPAVEEETTITPTVKENSGIPTIHLFGEMMQDQGLLTGNRQCFSLGPFHSDEDKDEVRLLLQEVSIRISERQTEALVEKGYWVFIPPYGSLLEANQALISLQALGLDDTVVVFDGDWKNAISLGYYMRQENAQSRKNSLESKGYEALMRVQRQGESRYWLDYEQNSGSSLIALDMQNRPNDFMQRSLPCPDEDVVEFAGAASQAPAQVMALLQVPEDEKEQAPGLSGDPDSGEDIESVPQEPVETPPEQTVETLTEAVIGSGAGDATETVPENAVGTGQEDAIETEPENAVGTGSEDAIESEAENLVGTGQEDAIGTESENAVGTGSGDAIESEPENAVVTGQEEAIGTELENAVVTGQEDAIGTEPDNAVGIGQEDAIETEPENAVGTGSEDAIESEPENTVGTGQEDANESEPENAVGTGSEDAIESEPENAVGTGQENAIETEPQNSVGTGPQDSIDIEPESTDEDELEDALEGGQKPADDTGLDSTSKTGTGEE